MSARLAIGIGARRGVDAEGVVMLVRKALASLSACGEEPLRLFTIDTKQDECGLHEAARLLYASIVFLPLEALLARKDDVLTRSARVEALLGFGSVAEAAALAGAGPGSRLLGPRLATKTLTCAIAQNTLDETS